MIPGLFKLIAYGVATIIALVGTAISLLLRARAEGKYRQALDTNTRNCPNCGRENSVYTRVCPRCGTKVDANGEPSTITNIPDSPHHLPKEPERASPLRVGRRTRPGLILAAFIWASLIFFTLPLAAVRGDLPPSFDTKLLTTVITALALFGLALSVSGWRHCLVAPLWIVLIFLQYSVSNTLDGAFCIAALEEALVTSEPEIFNTDQGVQFTSLAFTGCLESRGVAISMDGRGRALDNVFVERLWRTVKYEEVYLKDYANVWEAETSLREYFEFYCYDRRHQSLDNRTPAEVYGVQRMKRSTRRGMNTPR